MATTVMAGAVEGVDGVEVQVEVDLVRRLPRVTVVGLPASAVKESTERVRSAILASGLDFPKQRVTINLAPADVQKRRHGL
jgi:magnesium chelatase family protein